jgi:hypothetical protein
VADRLLEAPLLLRELPSFRLREAEELKELSMGAAELARRLDVPTNRVTPGGVVSVWKIDNRS